MLAQRLVRRCTLQGALLLGAWITASGGTAQAQQPLPGTQPLTWTGDLSLRMVDDLHAYADKATAASIERRARHWQRDFSTPRAYQESLEPNRRRLAKYLGVTYPTEVEEMRNVDVIADKFNTGDIAGCTYVHYILKMPEGFETDVFLWTETGDDTTERRPLVILLLDADQDLEPSTDDNGENLRWPAVVRKFIRRGFRVATPRIVNRGSELSTIAHGAKKTAQPHREYIYRQAFEMGRHVLGYEVTAILTWLEGYGATIPDTGGGRYGIVGYGEGGLVALYTAALDPRIAAVGVSGYFAPRERLWEEPIERNVWGLLDEFGDAELAAMVAPNRVVIEASRAPRVNPPPKEARNVTPGAIVTPALEDVRREVARARSITAGHKVTADRIDLVETKDGSGEPWSDEFIDTFAAAFSESSLRVEKANPGDLGLDSYGTSVDRQRQLVRSLTEHTQALVRESEYVRKDYWKNADRTSRDPAKWEASLGPYRKHLHEEVLGKIDAPLLPPNARTRQVYDTPKYTGYEVVLDVFDNDAEKADANVFAYGVLLVPKDLKAGEKRPVVVCQHGLEGRPRDTIEAGIEGERYYHRFAHHLAERGFVTFSPQNPYIGKNHFRQLVRKLNPLKLSLWSIIVPQHEQITTWLAGLDFVDGERIGFYGLSYGGKTAMRVPALVTRYCLSICSGDFNEWIRKCTSVRDPFSYMGTGEYEMFEFDLGHTFNYAEMAYLIAPRPFMVERGHRDGVGIDEWVGYEYGKVRLLYADLKIPERTEIEYFDGPHECHNVGTFDFLHRHLKWAAPK